MSGIIVVLYGWWWFSCYAVSNSWTPHIELTRLLYSWDFQARILEWVAISFSSGILPTQELNLWTHISCIAGGFFYHSDIREAHITQFKKKCALHLEFFLENNGIFSVCCYSCISLCLSKWWTWTGIINAVIIISKLMNQEHIYILLSVIILCLWNWDFFVS